MFHYLARLGTGKLILWCYLLWYLGVVGLHFDPSIRIWLNSAGISLVVGIALMLSVSRAGGGRMDRWQTFRLFLMPFCVSSFSTLIKDQGFVLIFPTRWEELGVLGGLCGAFLLVVWLVKRSSRRARSA